MTILTLGRPILLVCMWTRNVVSDAHALKERRELLVLPHPPIGLNSKYFTAKAAFNQLLKIMKLAKDFRFILKKINPYTLDIIINERDIILKSSNKGWGWAHTTEKISSKGALDTLKHSGNDSW
jgi:hypothetical protein